jgi:hypothetical protein
MSSSKYDRVKIIQQVIDKTAARNYLEIGVFRGDCFINIRARRKTAVDPAPDIPLMPRLKRWFKNLRVRIHAQPSDVFFAGLDSSVRFDVVFIDGLHTYEQTLRDVENSLRFLNDGGVVLMHDCNPVFAAAAHPAKSKAEASAMNLPGWTGEWNGDVWKAICHLRSHRPDLRVFVEDCDYGVGIVTRNKPDGMLGYSEAEISRMTYEDFAKNRQAILNLKPETYFPEFLESLPKIYSA